MIQKTWLRMMATISCLFDEQARQVVEYLKKENRVLREQLRDKYGCRQVRLTNSQRRARCKKLSNSVWPAIGAVTRRP